MPLLESHRMWCNVKTFGLFLLHIMVYLFSVQLFTHTIWPTLESDVAWWFCTDVKAYTCFKEKGTYQVITTMASRNAQEKICDIPLSFWKKKWDFSFYSGQKTFPTCSPPPQNMSCKVSINFLKKLSIYQQQKKSKMFSISVGGKKNLNLTISCHKYSALFCFW